jgi:hypothetical protein
MKLELIFIPAFLGVVLSVPNQWMHLKLEEKVD